MRAPLILCSLLSAVVAAAAPRWGEVLKQKPDWYASAEALTIADSIVAYQTKEGGWPKNTDMIAPPSAEFLANTKFDHRAPTIDNDATTTQIAYLAMVIAANTEKGARFKPMFERGFDYLLAAQYENGGWPQYYPIIKGYYTHITYNDDAMIEVMEVLRDAANSKAPYTFVDDARKAKAAAAVEKGIACILRTQVKQAGQLTVWCAQHDENTLAPAPARNFEPVSLSGAESVGIVRFLMQIPKPSPEVIAAVKGAVAWFEANAITGVRIDNSPGADGQRDRHTVRDPAAPRTWARFYELGTNKPIYIGRDKVIRYDFNEIERERRIGYNYLSTWAESLLTKDYPRWLAKNHLK